MHYSKIVVQTSAQTSIHPKNSILQFTLDFPAIFGSNFVEGEVVNMALVRYISNASDEVFTTENRLISFYLRNVALLNGYVINNQVSNHEFLLNSQIFYDFETPLMAAFEVKQPFTIRMSRVPTIAAIEFRTVFTNQLQNPAEPYPQFQFEFLLWK